MKNISLILGSALLLSSCVATSPSGVGVRTDDPTKYVDPFIGTDGIVHTFPGAAAPFGMIQLSPDNNTNGWNWCSGYHTSDSTVMGFSHNHLSGTGWSDLGDILIMPTVGKATTKAGRSDNPDSGYRSRISHNPANEVAKPGYYMVDLLDYKIKAELTANERIGVHRYTFPAADTANIIFDPDHKIFGKVFDTEVSVLNDSTIQGWCSSTGWGGERTVWFTAQLSRAFDAATMGKKGYVQYFNLPEGTQIEMKVSLSHVSQEGAHKNLASGKDYNFDSVYEQCHKAWKDQLSSYEFVASSESQLRILYTGLYHALLQPNLNMDVDGQFISGGASGTDKLSGDLRSTSEFNNYSTFSFWDTFRAANHFLTFTNHQVLSDIVNSLIERYQTNGNLPLWELLGFDNTCMIGYPAVAIIGDAIIKDIKGFDYHEAYKAMRNAAFTPYLSSSDGESGLEEYIALGYVPSEFHSSVAKTTEYAYYDWIIAQVAAKLGYADDAKLFTDRSMNFLNNWNSEKMLMWPKDKDGNWVEQDIQDWNSLQQNYVSGNIYSYSYFYPHAVDTMIALYGGKDKYVAALDQIMNTPLDMKGDTHVDISGFVGKYAHGDEPGHHFLYLYNIAGAPEKMAPWLHDVSNTFYSDSRDGMPNNDDCGQMSAWYIFSSMGFYPVCPGDGRYYIGAPMMHEATITGESGKKFRMTAENYSTENIYVQSVTLNGEKLEKGYITYQEIQAGGELHFVMGSSPVKF
ncbi:MAG: GH92 family glycosyl hydrolase [Rikenellaceae bacterium]